MSGPVRDTPRPRRAARSEFGPVTVQYDDRVLTPRPWTLMQSQWAAELAGAAPSGPILELCAGAGHIGLAAAAMSGRPLVQVEADDVAATYARSNAEAAGLADQVDVRHASMEEALEPDERFALIVADPPYLPSAALERWPDDPVRAIDGGPDGLDAVRICVRVSGEHLQPGGALLLQVAGTAQADAVRRLVAQRPEHGLEYREMRSHDADRAVMLLISVL